MMRIVVASLGVGLFTVSACAADPVTIRKQYELLGDYSKQDEACVGALATAIMSVFEGVKSINLKSTPSPTILSGVDASNIVYSGSEFSGSYGDATGSVVCTFPENRTSPSDIQITFDGRGLAGFKKHPLASSINDLAKQFATSYATTLSE